MASKTFPNRARPNFSDILIRPTASPDEGDVKVTTNTAGVRWQPGIKIIEENLDAVFDDEVFKEFLSYFAEIYKEEVTEAIEDQAYKNRWEPLSERYARWKKKAKLDSRHFIRTGQMLEAIRVRYFPQASSWGVGIDANERFKEVITVKNREGQIIDHKTGSRTDTHILFVARLLEYGTKDMPARKVWTPVKKKLQGNIRDYAHDFLRSEGYLG